MIFHSNNKPSISYNDLYDIDDEVLLRHYLGIKKIPCLINSPLRTDKNPSFSIYYNRNHRIAFYDFSTLEKGNIYELLSKMWQCDFHETVTKIYQDLPKMNVILNPNKVTHKYKSKTVNSNIGVKVRKWKDYDFEFWNSFGISKEWLEFGNVYPISHIFIDDRCFPAEKYAYVYVEFKDNKPTYKIYQPLSTRYKWMNNHDSSVWDLWEQLPKNGEKLIITSSRKDALCLWANLGIPSCCLQAETNLPKEHVVNQLIDRFEKIYLLYDNDFGKPRNTGQENAKQLCEKYNFINVCIESEYGAKDPSDFYKKYGKEKFIEYFNELMK